MPKDRNLDTERSILASTWDLFMEKGFTRTSYTDLAERSGVTRSTVQYYAPKKTLLAEACFRAVYTASRDVVRERIGSSTSWLANGYLNIQVMLAAYFASTGMRRFLQDVLYDRDLVQNLIELLFRMGIDEEASAFLERRQVPDGILVAVGGLSELLFTYLKRGSVPEISSMPVIGFMAIARELDLMPTPEGFDEFEATIDSLAMSNDELAPLGASALDRAPVILINNGLPK